MNNLVVNDLYRFNHGWFEFKIINKESKETEKKKAGKETDKNNLIFFVLHLFNCYRTNCPWQKDPDKQGTVNKNLLPPDCYSQGYNTREKKLKFYYKSE